MPATASLADVHPLPRSTVQEIATSEATTHAQAIHETVLHVTDGVVYVVLEDDERALTPGDRVTIRAGEAYRLWNAGDDDARVCYEAVPAPQPVSVRAVRRRPARVRGIRPAFAVPMA